MSRAQDRLTDLGTLAHAPVQAADTSGPGTADHRDKAPEKRAGRMTGGTLSIVAGLLTFVGGLTAVAGRQSYPALPGYAYRLNVHAWGLILLALGVLLVAAGAAALLGTGWARMAGLGLAAATAVSGFLFLAYTPVWGVVVVALSVIAIWGLLDNGGGHREAG